MWLNCKVIKKCQPPSPPFISASTSPFQVYPPFLAKNFVPTQVTQFSEGGEGFSTMCTLLRLHATPKPLQLPFLFFFFFYISFSSLFFQRLPKVFLSMFHHFSHRKRGTKIALISLDTLNQVCVKIVLLSHVLIYGNQHSQHHKKHKKKPKTRNKLKDSRAQGQNREKSSW